MMLIIVISITIISIVFFLLLVNLPSLYRLLYGKVSIKFSDFIIIVTGCDTGFGAMLALALHQIGYFVIATTLTKEGYDWVSTKVSKAIICDVRKAVDVQLLGEITGNIIKIKKLKLWAVINNAGIADGGCFDWTPFDVFYKTMDVNYFGILRVLKVTLPYLKQTTSSRIINISSIAGLTACGPLFGAYAGSKHAVEGMTKSLRIELKGWDIQVCNINPSFMKTPLILSAFVKMQRTFDSAPEHIKSQYWDSDITDMLPLVEKSCEDPLLVVKEVMEVVTDKYPLFNHYIGTASHSLRIFNMLPFPIQEWLVDTMISLNTLPSFSPSKAAVINATTASLSSNED